MTKNQQENAILERLHQVLGQMLRTSELDMAKTITPDDINVFLNNAAWAICSNYHTVLKASPGAATYSPLKHVSYVALGTQRKIQSTRHTRSHRKLRDAYFYSL